MEVLVIGRFQIFGNQHVYLFEQILDFYKDNPFNVLNIGIGVSDNFDFRNPFTPVEVLKMVKPVVDRMFKDKNVVVKYRLIDDISDDDYYYKHVSDIFNFKNDVVLFSSNDDTIKCFLEKKNFSVVKAKEKFLHSSVLREKILNDEDISLFVPETTLDFLKQKDFKKRFRCLKNLG